jgi:hypothetical protein
MIPELGDEKIIITADQGFMKKFCRRKFTYVAFANKGLSILKSYKIPMEWKSYLLETFRKSWTHH